MFRFRRRADKFLFGHHPSFTIVMMLSTKQNIASIIDSPLSTGRQSRPARHLAKSQPHQSSNHLPFLHLLNDCLKGTKFFQRIIYTNRMQLQLPTNFGMLNIPGLVVRI